MFELGVYYYNDHIADTAIHGLHSALFPTGHPWAYTNIIHLSAPHDNFY